ncbi:plasmid stabilization protein [Rhodopseudomonas sp. AAP120]|uniref:type II toxin-antitoxin system RelE/ParE family toxin n=1 Tax=Rhodopseudomonas sp. AAP120 TaxID=1523430 RepID=UPI0006B9154A|nr:type II toxin-antitoxin system RelE/ParE family toxin [Rhodopseudomonas sp. AAP120]KPF95714.1 plasmid stabilization protein [Rhodopseudomonas sp. AAP120]
MSVRLTWTLAARQDLLDIYDAIASEPSAAERMLDRIEASVVLLASQPRMGVRRRDIRPSLRMLVERPYLILYRTEPDTDEGPVRKVEIVRNVEIVRVVDGRRDLNALIA